MGIAVLIVLGMALLGLPLYSCLAALGLTGLFLHEGAGFAGLPGGITDVTAEFTGAKAVSLSTIPLFTFAGYVLAQAKTAQRLVRLGTVVLGWIPGGLALLTLFVCAFFTTFTGASGVTIVAVGGLILPSLERAGYSKRFSLEVVTGSGTVGLLFPPSLPLIVYGIVFGITRGQMGATDMAEFSVEKFLFAGIIPGLVLLALLSTYCVFEGWRSNAPRFAFKPWKVAVAVPIATLLYVLPITLVTLGTERAQSILGSVWALPGGIGKIGLGALFLGGMTWGLLVDKELRQAVWDLKWEIPIPFLVIGLLATGKAQIPESAALCALYVLVIEVFIYRDVEIKSLFKVTRESMTLVGAIFMKMIGATILTAYLILAEVPTRLFEWMSQYVHSASTFLLVLNVVLLIVGCLMDIFSAIIVVVPLIVPAATQFHIDPYHLGVIFLLNLEIGYLLPPAGLNLFIAAFRFRRPITELYRAVVPFILIMLVALLLVSHFDKLTYVPGREAETATVAPSLDDVAIPTPTGGDEPANQPAAEPQPSVPTPGSPSAPTVAPVVEPPGAAPAAP